MRMPGRFRRDGCGNFRCRLCGPNGDEIKRWRKRVEAREVAAEIEDERRECVDVLLERMAARRGAAAA